MLGVVRHCDMGVAYAGDPTDILLDILGKGYARLSKNCLNFIGEKSVKIVYLSLVAFMWASLFCLLFYSNKARALTSTIF